MEIVFLFKTHFLYKKRKRKDVLCCLWLYEQRRIQTLPPKQIQLLISVGC